LAVPAAAGLVLAGLVLAGLVLAGPAVAEPTRAEAALAEADGAVRVAVRPRAAAPCCTLELEALAAALPVEPACRAVELMVTLPGLAELPVPVAVI
jgi:hypothetical protein